MGFTLQGFGPFLHWLTLGVLALFPVLAAYALYRLGSLPGVIARSRGHPQADAINICGWMGVVTIVLWPIAMVWAHLATGDKASTTTGLQQALRRLDEIEANLPRVTTGGD